MQSLRDLLSSYLKLLAKLYFNYYLVKSDNGAWHNTDGKC